MGGFKLLAIRPLEKCDQRFLKNLKEGMVYSFYQGYKYYVKDAKGNEFEVLPTNYDSFKHLKSSRVDPPNEQIDLYSKGDLKINISAIVGKNGSGKSSLTELFFKYIFELSISNLKKRDPSKLGESCIDLGNELMKLSQDNQHLQSSKIAQGEKYYPTDIEDEFSRIDLLKENEDEISKIHQIQNDLINHSILHRIEVYYEINGVINCFNGIGLFPFYSIVVNHSSYSLNSELIGKWIEKLFHKNDGYETPVVLNPMRTRGNIDGNNESHLNKTRLLLNMKLSVLFGKKIQSIEFTRNLPDLTNGKQFNSLFQNLSNDNIFSMEGDEFTSLDVKNRKISGNQLSADKNEIEKWIIAFSKKINIHFPEILILEQFNSSKILSGILIEEEKKIFLKIMLFRYLQLKIIKYARFKKLGHQASRGYQIKNLDNLLIELKKDTSHQTFKLFQILHLLSEENFNNFYSLIDAKTITLEKIELSINENSFKQYNAKFKFLTGLKSEIDVFKVPAAFFSVDFTFENESKFGHLSSGEIQFLNSINQVTYHLRNIDSINYSYEVINIIFDEVELYFHVEYQRIFISKLIEAIEMLELKRIKKINIQFLTHSPFILSDIPASNILRLEHGKVSTKEFNQTFGANIHDLLANDFFLKDGFMGEFAKEKINETIRFINDKKLLNELTKLIPELENEYSGIVDKSNDKAKKLQLKIESVKNDLEELNKIEFETLKQDKIRLINSIGELALKSKLTEMYYNAFGKSLEVDSYEKELNELKIKHGKND